MKSVKNCKKCGRIYVSYDGDNLCKACDAEEEKVFRPIREYLCYNPGTSAYELANRFGISVTRIQRYIQNSRFNCM